MTALHPAPTLSPVVGLRTRPEGSPGAGRPRRGAPGAPGAPGASAASVPLRVMPSRRSAVAVPEASAVAPDEPLAGRLLVDASRSALSPHLRGRRIVVSVDGRRCTCEWGRATIDLPPGRHEVAIEVEHGAGWGRATDAVPVAAGSTVPVFYRAPVLPGAAGPLGPAPRTRARASGAAVGVAAVAAATLTTVLAVVLVLVALVGALVG